MHFSPRRWNYFKDRLIERFGALVYKVGVDAGFDCPNRDGNKAFGGCAYCSQQGSLAPNQDPRLGITEQIQKGISFVKRRYKAQKHIIYLQAFTNTYGSLEFIKERYQAILDAVNPECVGLSIATRPDCIDEQKLEYLKKLSQNFSYFTLELGLQSAFQNRLPWVNRQETVEDYLMAMKLCNDYEIPVISHVIFGFPGESSQDMLETVKIASDAKTYGIKLQMLHVIKKTKLAVMYERNPFKLLNLEEYRDLVIEALEILDPKIEIHRITGETDKNELIAPLWTQQKQFFFKTFEDELEKRNTWQGKRFLSV